MWYQILSKNITSLLMEDFLKHQVFQSADCSEGACKREHETCQRKGK